MRRLLLPVVLFGLMGTAFAGEPTIDGTFYYYDPVDSRLLSLKFDDLHIDFLAVPNGKQIVVTQPVCMPSTARNARIISS